MRKTIDGLTVEWDANKDNINKRKHKIGFDVAVLVFRDKNRIEFYDAKHSDIEERYITIGLINDVVTVVYTERSDALRIISARIATKAERKAYYGKDN